MKRFACPVCGNELHFSNDLCLRCDAPVAYDPVTGNFAALPTEPVSEGIQACANRAAARCNWLVAPGEGPFCIACRHNRTIPDLGIAGNAERWAALEQAKRYLFYSILRWNLPHPTPVETRKNALEFEFLADEPQADGTVRQVLTGHAGGLITLNVAEADDAERVARREAMGEPYRTLIGHMRHEVGHYYWELLISDCGRLEEFRAIFGDERRDYAAALRQHYETPDRDWQTDHISSYAASHPWEDWAECWAHYTHIVDASETAHAFGMSLRFGTVTIGMDPYRNLDYEALIGDWVPLTVAVNSLNRSMGQPDLYPFVLAPPVLQKLRFIHEVIVAQR